MTLTTDPATITTDAFTLTRLTGTLGARVEGGALDDLLGDGQARADLRSALHEHGVLVFKRAHPTHEQHIALASAFGSPEPPHAQNVPHPHHPEICVFDSAEGYKADKWHADETFSDQPSSGAVLRMVQKPSFGGDTVWTNVGAAYDRLSNGMKELLAKRRAMHEIRPGVSAMHPVIRTHPDTGRRVIYVNEIFVRGIQNLPDGEGEAILGFLLHHIQSPDFQYRHGWDEGDLVAWDNHLTQHYAASDYTERRVVHRVGFRGTPFPVAS
jgi:taurine dioxygenase